MKVPVPNSADIFPQKCPLDDFRVFGVVRVNSLIKNKTPHDCCIHVHVNESVSFSHCVHLKVGQRFHALLKVCSDRDDTVPLNVHFNRPLCILTSQFASFRGKVRPFIGHMYARCAHMHSKAWHTYLHVCAVHMYMYMYMYMYQ